MLKETITYFDYDGVERTEDFYFNLTKAECMELELSTDGGLRNAIDGIIKSKDKAKIIKTFKDIVLKAYGEKSADGKYFMKSPEISAKFAATEAYSDLFIRLASSADEATRFINGIVPVVPEDAMKAADLKKNMIPGA